MRENRFEALARNINSYNAPSKYQIDKSNLRYDNNQKGDLIMQIKDLKMLFDAGSLKKAQITKAPIGNGYILLTDTHVLQAQRGGERVFKSLDAAAESAAKIGFHKIEIVL